MIWCDLLHKSEASFNHTTIRTIIERYEKYAEMKGFKEPTREIQEFDDEGM